VLEQFTAETFGHRVGESFRVDTGSGIRELRLVEVTKPSTLQPAARRAPFSLFFLDSDNDVLPQRIYAFDHDELGSFEIFIVPIGQDRHGVRYEAAFA
jgi:hypothetical protein